MRKPRSSTRKIFGKQRYFDVGDFVSRRLRLIRLAVYSFGSKTSSPTFLLAIKVIKSSLNFRLLRGWIGSRHDTAANEHASTVRRILFLINRLSGCCSLAGPPRRKSATLSETRQADNVIIDAFVIKVQAFLSICPLASFQTSRTFASPRRFIPARDLLISFTFDCRSSRQSTLRFLSPLGRFVRKMKAEQRRAQPSPSVYTPCVFWKHGEIFDKRD